MVLLQRYNRSSPKETLYFWVAVFVIVLALMAIGWFLSLFDKKK